MMPVMTQFQVQKVLANELTGLLNDLSVTGLEKCNISAVCFRKCLTKSKLVKKDSCFYFSLNRIQSIIILMQLI